MLPAAEVLKRIWIESGSAGGARKPAGSGRCRDYGAVWRQGWGRRRLKRGGVASGGLGRRQVEVEGGMLAGCGAEEEHGRCAGRRRARGTPGRMI